MSKNRFATIFWAFVVAAALAACASPKTEKAEGFPLQEGTAVVLLDPEAAAERLATPDAFTDRLSAFDIPAIAQDTSIRTKEALFDYLRQRPQAWDDQGRDALRAAVASVRRKLDSAGVAVPLPPVVEVIVTDMKEASGAAGYTRGGYVALNAKYLKAPGQALERLFLHELFHVISRKNPELRDRLYALLGFEPCEEVAYPEPVAHLRITNPDAPVNAHFLTVDTVKGEYGPTPVVMALLARGPYQGGPFFGYLDKALMALEGEGESKRARLVEGPGGPEPVLYSYAETNVKDYIGRNTGYDIHPEEVSADHFVMVVQGDVTGKPDPELLMQMGDVLREFSEK